MIVHEEFAVYVHAPNGGKCEFCDADAEHGLFVSDDRGITIFSHGNMCPMHTLWFVNVTLTQGPRALMGK